MQAQVSKPSAKAILAAQRAAKKAKILERGKPQHKTDRNAAYFHKKAVNQVQAENIKLLTDGEPISHDEAVTCKCILWLNYNEMRYAHTQDNQNFAEHIIRQVQRLAAIVNYGDEKAVRNLDFACMEATTALIKWVKEFDNLSPNQRDLVLRPIRDLFFAYDRFLDEYPSRRLIANTATYALAIRVVKKTATFMEMPAKIMGAVGRVINGEDSRKVAKSIGIAYQDFYPQALYAANLLYDVGVECADHLQELHGKPLKKHRPQTIADLRQPMLKLLADNKGDLLVKVVRESEKLIKNEDEATGVSCFNHEEHRKRMANIFRLSIKEKN